MRVCPECRRKTEALTCPLDGTPTMDEALLRESADPLIGRVLAGRYRVLEPLGHGAMGRVYVADQITMRRRVALKVIRAETLAAVADRLNLVRRFQREALAASRLRHPNTVQVHDYGSTEDGVLFLVMELLEGAPLARVLQREGRLTPERAVRIGVQVLRSLAEAHAQGIVHRDLKPENIMLTRPAGEADFVKVLDFGIAKVALPGTGDSAMTHSGIVLGTPVYMAPEQGMGRGVGPAADLYALGVILYECLTGRVPFSAETALGVMMKHVQEPVPPLVRDGSPPDVTPALEELVLALLAKRPEDRPGPAMQVAALLEASLGRGVRKEEAREDDTTVKWPSGDRADASDTATLAIEELRRRRVRRTLAWVGVGVVALGLGVVGVVHLSVSGGSPAVTGRVEDAAVEEGTRASDTERSDGPRGKADVNPVQDTTVGREVGGAGPLVEPAPPSKTAGPERTVPRSGRAVERRARPAKRAAPSPGPPACTTLRCPFTRECVGPDGRRVLGTDWCPPAFR